MLAGVVLLLAGWSSPGPTRAAAPPQQRYAIVIGSNLGEPDEEALVFAERDAARVGDALTKLAAVSPQNLIMLRAPTRQTVEGVLVSLKARVAAERANGAARPLLFVYYSGHADVSSLHLAGTRLSFSRFKQLVTAVGADVNVFIVDACRSGGLTRVKGATPAEPFEIKAEDELQSSGFAIITSSAAGEDAQESDRLKGGIFTHHLLTGLHGAADASRDQRITLSEAYRYAYTQTLRTTTRTRFVQHPTYAFRIKGRQELVLARIGQGEGFGRLRLVNDGRYVLMEQSRTGHIVAELAAQPQTDVLVTPGTYLVRRRDRREVYEATVRVPRGGVTQLDVAQMTRIPYGRTVRKGLAERDAAVWSLGGAFEVSGPMMDAMDVGLYGAVGVQVDLPAVALQARFRYGHSGGGNSEVTLIQDMVGLDLALFHLFDIESAHLAIGVGVRAGADWVMQRFETRGKAPDRSQMVGRVAPALRLEIAPTPGFTLALDGGVDIYFVGVGDEDGGARIATPVVPFGNLSFGVYLP